MGRLLTRNGRTRRRYRSHYDRTGNQLNVTDPEGNVTKYIYDLLGRAVRAD